MSTKMREYIGSRYVPTFGRKDEDSIVWDNTKPYEPLTIVLYQGASYTSRQYVPAGVDIANEQFWALTGNYNAQVEAYRQEVQTFDARINDRVIAFDNVGQMVASTRLYSGAICHTNGFHVAEDCGAAWYKIVADAEPNEMDILELNSGLFAVLQVTEDYVTPEMFGAWGDDMHDDSPFFNRMFAVAKKVAIPSKTYSLSNSINIAGRINVEGKGSILKYQGSESAIVISAVTDNTDMNFGDITALSGNCIELFGKSGTEYVQYLNLSFSNLRAHDKCIYIHANTGSWVNEIRYFNGRLMEGAFGVYADANGEQNICEHNFYAVGVESPSVGFYIANNPYAYWKIKDIRIAEANIVLKTYGNVRYVDMYCESLLTMAALDLSENTNRVNIFCDLEEGVDGTIIVSYHNEVFNGKIYAIDSRPIRYNGSSKELVDFNNMIAVNYHDPKIYNMVGVGNVANGATVILPIYIGVVPGLNDFYVYDGSGYNTTVKTFDGKTIYDGVIGYNKTLKFTCYGYNFNNSKYSWAYEEVPTATEY